MNRDALIKTAVTRWEKGCYLTQSPLDHTLSGTGQTEGDAMASFIEGVDLAFQYYQQGKHALYTKPGRPRKNRFSIYLQVDAKTQERIKQLAQTLGISQGEVLDYLVCKHA